MSYDINYFDFFRWGHYLKVFKFYVLSFFKKGDTIQGGTLFKEIRYVCFWRQIDFVKIWHTKCIDLWKCGLIEEILDQSTLEL